jgi:hypothetical protein
MSKSDALYAVLRTRDKEVRNAERQREQAVIEAFPVGARAFWNHGEGIARVEVTSHGYGGSVVIRNLDTDKLRRVDGWDERLTL